jgi:PPK2 family polyphosphate:nucleotide phosphotransferase
MAVSIDLDRYRAAGSLRLRDHDPSALPGGLTEARAEQLLEASTLALRRLQERLYAHGRWSLLVVLQGMDTAGKDSAIKRIFNGVNPQGCTVHSFKAPSDEELDHDFLWRTCVRLPRRGQIGIFNRSYYEEVLVVRVHADLLHAQRLPEVPRRVWRDRFEDIVAHERHLVRNGTVIRKFFLNISKEEQRRRLLKRIDNPAKHWKFSARDVDQRQHWAEYMRAYEDAIRSTSTREAPWYVIPADRKWWAGAIISAAIVEALESLDLASPAPSAESRREMRRVRRLLRA